MKKLCFLLSAMLYFLPSYGQKRIQGVVYDKIDSTAIEGASINCLSNSVSLSNGVSDSNGKFNLSFSTTSKDVYVEINHIGYTPYILSVSETELSKIDLGKVYLEPNTLNLSGVVVSANSNRIDKSLIVPSKNDIKRSVDIYGLLETMNLRNMNIDVLNKKVAVGGLKPLWKINGIPKEENEIGTIRPESILRIEYSDIASIRERDRGYGGVINIILKQEKEEGGFISANANTAFTTGFINGGVQTSYHKGKNDFSLNYSTSYRRYSKWTKDEKSLFISPVDTIIRNIMGVESRFGYLSQNINLGYTHSFNTGTSLSITMRNPFYYQHNEPQSILQDNTHREVNSSYQGYTPSIDIFFGKNFKNYDRLEVNLVGTYGFVGKSRYTMQDKQNGIVKGTYDMPADTKRRSLIWEAFYLHRMGNHSLKTGVQNTLGKSINSYYAPHNYKDELTENNTYAYAQMDGQFGKVQYSLGTGLKYNMMDNGVKRKYWRNQTQVVLSYSPSNNLFLRYYGVYYPTMPSLFALTTVEQRIDDLQILTGNPYLKSTQNIYNGILVSYSKKNFRTDFQIIYQYADNPIFMHIEYDNLQKLFVNKYINGLYDSQIGLNYSASLKQIWGFMNIMGDIGYNHYRAKTEETSNTLGNIYWNLTVQLYYKNFTLSAYLMQPRKTLYNEIISRDEKISRIMLSWKKNNLTLTAAFFNPFTPKGSNYIDETLSKYNPGESKVSIRDNGNMFTIGVSWNFRFGKSSRNNSVRSLNNADNNNSILRREL